jgi:hypothetical protein
MGFIQSMFGSSTGAGYTAQGTTPADLQAAQTGVNTAEGRQQSLAGQLAQQGGIQNQNQVFQEQQGLSNQLGQLSQGQGPNPALNQLNQTTAANMQNQAALAAGQRGASANAGLLARQVGQQGAATQQQAAGQAATMSAQQQLNYTNALQQQQANMANLATQQVGQQIGAVNSQAQTALGNQGNLYGLQGNINTVQANIAEANQKSQAGLIGGVLGSAGANIAGNSGGTPSGNYAHGGEVRLYKNGGDVDFNQVLMPNAQGQVQGAQAPSGPSSQVGRFLAGAQSLTQSPEKSTYQAGNGLGDLAIKGGKALYKWATGPTVSATPSTAVGGESAGSTDLVGTGAGGDAAAGTAAGDAAASDAVVAGAADAGASDAAALLLVADGGEVGGEATQDPTDALGFIMSYLNKGGVTRIPKQKGKTVHGAEGRVVPGKATKKGDSIKNDTVPARLSPGEIVIPRSIAQGPNAPQNAAKFVQAVLAKQGLKRK